MREHVDLRLDGDALHVDGIRMRDQQQAALASLGTHSLQCFFAHDRPVAGGTEAVLDEDLDTTNAGRGELADDDFRRVLSRVRARG